MDLGRSLRKSMEYGIFQEGLQSKLADQKIFNPVFQIDLPGKIAIVAELFNFQIQSGDFQLIPDGDQISGFPQSHPVKTGEVCDHFIGNIQLSQRLAGLYGSQNVIQKMGIDLRLEKLVFQPLFCQRQVQDRLHIGTEGSLHFLEGQTKFVNFIIGFRVFGRRDQLLDIFSRSIQLEFFHGCGQNPDLPCKTSGNSDDHKDRQRKRTKEGDQDGLDQDIYIVPDIRIRDFCYMVPAVLKPYGVVADLIFLI